MGSIYNMELQDKGMVHAQMGLSRTVGDFIMLPQMVCNLKLKNCVFFRIFHLIFSAYNRPWVTENAERKLRIRGVCNIQYMKHGHQTKDNDT